MTPRKARRDGAVTDELARVIDGVWAKCQDASLTRGDIEVQVVHDRDDPVRMEMWRACAESEGWRTA
jgi:hypothetical protein